MSGWTRFEHIAAWLFASFVGAACCLALGAVIWWKVIQPKLPIEQDISGVAIHADGSQGPFKAGDTLRVRWVVKILRDCPRAHYSRRIAHEAGEVISLSSHPGSFPVVAQPEPKRFVANVPLPADLPKGKWRYYVDVLYECNPIASWRRTSNPVEFEVR